MNTLGRHVYGLAAIALGAIGLKWDDFAAVWQPVPDDLLGRATLAYVAAGAFLLAGLAMQWRRTARIGAGAATIMFAIFALLWVKRVIGFPTLFATYSGVAEQLAITTGGVMAYASVVGPSSRTLTVCRIVFGVCLLAFGGAHFVYVKETAEMVPAWIPPNPNIWAYITGAAHAAAGLALISGVLAPLAARLVTLMFVAFGTLVWAPQLMAHANDHTVWCGNAINLALVGAAWVLGDALAQKNAAQ